MAKQQTIKLGDETVILSVTKDKKMEIRVYDDHGSNAVTVTKPQLATLMDTINMFAADNL